MELIANGINGSYLESTLPGSDVDVDGVMAAIAYGNDDNEKLINNCTENGRRLDIWMRYDHTVPVAIPLLKRILKSHRKNVFCKLIPDALHSKVIWWKGYGAYIGSANLTGRAWNSNIEAGIFLTEDDLEENGISVQLDEFFSELKLLDKAFSLTKETIEELEAIQSKRKNAKELGKELRKTPFWQGLTFHDKRKAKDRRKEAFRKEWHDTLTILRDIGDQLVSNRPSWVESEVPIGWQIDQFLHAYYYNKVGEGLKKPFEEYFQLHKGNPQIVLEEELRWWKQTKQAPSNEEVNLYTRAPYIKEHLAEEHILDLDESEFTVVCSYTHATLDHLIKVSLSKIGRPDIKSLSRSERIPLFAKWLLGQRNKKGWNVLQLLKFVLYEGSDSDLWDRLYSAAKNPDYRLPQYGINSIAEVVGWVRPEVAPPRNGRTSKALRALGYEVEIY